MTGDAALRASATTFHCPYLSAHWVDLAFYSMTTELTFRLILNGESEFHAVPDILFQHSVHLLDLGMNGSCFKFAEAGRGSRGKVSIQ
jgi:hypothetical protein